MKDLRYSMHIEASREKIWEAMLQDATYREWTAAFMPGSYYVGDWSEGSEMRFLGPGAVGEKEGGMAARVKENRLHEFISLEHIGEIQAGIVKPFPESSYENYTLTDQGAGTEVVVDMLNIPDEFSGMLDGAWPKALQSLKALAEK
jgi:uncharacterized protein YndB with AHSA1/START domain